MSFFGWIDTNRELSLESSVMDLENVTWGGKGVARAFGKVAERAM